MAYSLPPLPYAFDALEPHIDALTMEIHHDRHHGTYVTNLNKALESAPDLANLPIEDLMRDLNRIPEGIRTAVRNNGGGHVNHAMFWQIMGPHAGGEPVGALAEAISRTFGSFADLKTKVNTAATGRFGSGWAWLVMDGKGALSVTSTPNQDTPISVGLAPILGVDVWEHAYYLKYQNKRPDYLNAWWNTVRWDKVAERFEAARKSVR
jgi:Fe-Mn family superoxide dismutase